MTVLKKGSRGSEVKRLQQLLGIQADGVFGTNTENAVKTFQGIHGLTPDGIVGSKTWNALEGLKTPTAAISDTPYKLTKTTRRKIKGIILHCTATPEGKDYNVATIRQWHLQRGFSDIGYHYVVYRDGSVYAGRNVDIAGAHCSNHNSYTIGVCYVGGCASDGKTAKDTRTPQQKAALVKLAKQLCSMYGLKETDVYGHYQFAAKACPSFKIEPFRAEMKA